MFDETTDPTPLECSVINALAVVERLLIKDDQRSDFQSFGKGVIVGLAFASKQKKIEENELDLPRMAETIYMTYKNED